MKHSGLHRHSLSIGSQLIYSGTNIAFLLIVARLDGLGLVGSVAVVQSLAALATTYFTNARLVPLRIGAAPGSVREGFGVAVVSSIAGGVIGNALVDAPEHAWVGLWLGLLVPSWAYYDARRSAALMSDQPLGALVADLVWGVTLLIGFVVAGSSWLFLLTLPSAALLSLVVLLRYPLRTRDPSPGESLNGRRALMFDGLLAAVTAQVGVVGATSAGSSSAAGLVRIANGVLGPIANVSKAVSLLTLSDAAEGRASAKSRHIVMGAILCATFLVASTVFFVGTRLRLETADLHLAIAGLVLTGARVSGWVQHQTLRGSGNASALRPFRLADLLASIAVVAVATLGVTEATIALAGFAGLKVLQVPLLERVIVDAVDSNKKEAEEQEAEGTA